MLIRLHEAVHLACNSCRLATASGRSRVTEQKGVKIATRRGVRPDSASYNEPWLRFYATCLDTECGSVSESPSSDMQRNKAVLAGNTWRRALLHAGRTPFLFVLIPLCLRFDVGCPPMASELIPLRSGPVSELWRHSLWHAGAAVASTCFA